jgi:hypothetical protein
MSILLYANFNLLGKVMLSLVGLKESTQLDSVCCHKQVTSRDSLESTKYSTIWLYKSGRYILFDGSLLSPANSTHL